MLECRSPGKSSSKYSQVGWDWPGSFFCLDTAVMGSWKMVFATRDQTFRKYYYSLFAKIKTRRHSQYVKSDAKAAVYKVGNQLA